jgi:spore maturation protein CgeB
MGKKSILIIGSTHVAALELIFSRELSKLGVRNEVLGIQDIFLDYYSRSIFNKVIYRLRLSSIQAKLQKRIKAGILKFKPQIVIVFKGMEIQPKTLMWIKSMGVKIANYNPDSPFIFSGRGSGNKNVTKSIKLFDLYFTYDKLIKIELEKRGVRSELIPFGFDSNGFIYNELKEEDEILKLCFLGNADRNRVSFIQELATKGIKIDVYGENWASSKMHLNVTIFGPLYGDQFWKTLQKYAIQLNLLRPHNLTSHNMRSFDIPGSGGIMLAPRTPDHTNYFSESTEIFLFSSIDDAIAKIHHCLQMSFRERNKIRQAARHHAESRHTYTNRVKQLIFNLEA